MITLFLILLALIIIAILLLALAGVAVIAWPVLLILGLGLLIDVLFFKLIFGRKKK